jgi:hypothetical protein
MQISENIGSDTNGDAFAELKRPGLKSLGNGRILQKQTEFVLSLS